MSEGAKIIKFIILLLQPPEKKTIQQDVWRKFTPGRS